MNYKLTIGWLYPELMSTYGDRGNIISLAKRCEWRNIEAEVRRLELGFKIEDLKKCDILFMGGAQDKQQSIVSHDFSTQKIKTLKRMIEDGIPGLYICGAYQFLGKYYKEADGTIIKGLGILDLYTESRGKNFKRLIGNIIIETRIKKLVGFENHGGRTYLGKNIKPLGTIVKGFGNNGDDKTEGAMYKNSFGSYLHGPILPKNPHFADLLIQLSLKKKYKQPFSLAKLEDTLEWKAHEAIANRLGIGL
ncbi:MAG: hypothetical protein ACD_50C00026G0011 [uncultured bacterium]|nr:MAG: hypothetical protein ACD_50C00026G0011 [uncultured bacterium]OGH13067.1 MAG: hypothetical protein A2687_04330 [Candidatus Levybacteria bacterium RIFCSPHIGHO2_01_FULL_38_26]